MEAVKSKLDDYMKEIRKRLNDNAIEYTHTKYRYELEISEKLIAGN